MKHIANPIILLLVIISLCFSGCIRNNNVPGAIPGSQPHFVGGATSNAVAGAANQGIVNKVSTVWSGLLGGAALGAAIASYEDYQGLIRNLNAQGVTIIQLGDTLEVVIPTDYLFDGGEDNMKVSAQSTMNNVVKLLKQFGASNITVSAHTDNVGNLFQKLALSEKQAQSVTTYLWSHGINLQRMRFYGLADREDVASFDTARGAGFNRRIQISLWRKDYTNAPSPIHIYRQNNVEPIDCWKSDNPSSCYSHSRNN